MPTIVTPNTNVITIIHIMLCCCESVYCYLIISFASLIGWYAT